MENSGFSQLVLSKQLLRRVLKICLQDLVDNSESLGCTLQVGQLRVDFGQIEVALLVGGGLVGPANNLNDVSRVNAVLDGSAGGRAVLRVDRVDVQGDVDVWLGAVGSLEARLYDFDYTLDIVLSDIISREAEHAFLFQGLQNLFFGRVDRAEAHVDEVARVQFWRLSNGFVAGQAQDVVDGHSVAVAGARSLGRVDVRVGVDPNQNGVGVHLERGTDRSVADGVIAADRE